MLTRDRCVLVVMLSAAMLTGAVTGCASHADSGGALRPLPVATAPPTTVRSTPTSSPPLTGRQAVLAAVRHYYAVLNRLHVSMDAGAMRALFTAGCPCQAQVRAISAAAKRGEHYVDHASINVMRPSLQGARHAFVLVNLDLSRGGLSRADGSRVTTAAPQHGVQRVFRLVLVHGHWQITRIEVG